MLKHRHGGDIYSTAYRIDYSANINPLGTPARVTEGAKECYCREGTHKKRIRSLWKWRGRIDFCHCAGGKTKESTAFGTWICRI